MKGKRDEEDISLFSAEIFRNVTNFVDSNLRVIRYTSYGLAAVGGIFILRSTFAFNKFRHVSDIPDLYIRTHARLQGRVKSVAPPGVLHVDHIPVISLKSIHKQGCAGQPAIRHVHLHLDSQTRRYLGDGNLVVRLGGVQVLPPGETWLRQTLQDRQIWFKVLCLTSEGKLDCEVTTKKSWFRSMCVNKVLVEQGLAKIHPVNSLPYNDVCNKLVSNLIKAEMYAEKKGRGVWARPSLKEKISAVPSNIKQSVKDYSQERLLRVKSFAARIPGIGILREKLKRNSKHNSPDESFPQTQQTLQRDTPATGPKI